MVEIVAVKLLNTDAFLDVKDKLFSLLPPIVNDKLTNFKHFSAMQRSLWGEILVRKLLSEKLNIKSQEILFDINDKGKPFLKDIPVHFNISHSGDWVVAAFSDDIVGIDVELIHNVNYDIASRFFSVKEFNDLFSIIDEGTKKLYFFNLWTLKESYLKLIGTGLTKPLNTFTVTYQGDNITLTDDENPIANVFFRQYIIDDAYKLSACSFSNSFSNDIKVLTIKDIL